MTLSLPASESHRRAAPALLVQVGGLTVVGLLFNLARIGLHLDQGSLRLSLVAFWGLLAITGVCARALGLPPAELGLRRPAALPSLAGGGLALAVLVGAAVMTGPALHIPAGRQLLSGLVLFGLGTAPAEELLFRGVVYRLLEPLGAPAAVFGSAAAFALVHVPVYGWLSLPVAVTAGLLLGWLRWWSRSLAAPVVVHTAADLALVWL